MTHVDRDNPDFGYNENFTAEVLDCILNYDDSKKSMARKNYASAYTYDQKGIPGKVAVASAGVGHAYAKDGILEADARGPNAQAMSKATLTGFEAKASSSVGKAYAKAGPFLGASAEGPNAAAKAKLSVTGVGAGFDLALAKVSGNVGPLTATAGLALDTDIGVGTGGVSVKVCGTGVSIRDGLEISFLGSSLKLF